MGHQTISQSSILSNMHTVIDTATCTLSLTQQHAHCHWHNVQKSWTWVMTWVIYNRPSQIQQGENGKEWWKYALISQRVNFRCLPTERESLQSNTAFNLVRPDEAGHSVKEVQLQDKEEEEGSITQWFSAGWDRVKDRFSVLPSQHWSGADSSLSPVCVCSTSLCTLKIPCPPFAWSKGRHNGQWHGTLRKGTIGV